MITPKKPRPPAETQSLLNLKPVKEAEIGGIGMGVMSDGTAYLTGAGLARMCGIAEPTIREIATNWASEQHKQRGARVADLLHQHGYKGANLFMPISVNGSTHNAYPDAVCMAFLEYYAFEAGANAKEQAAKNYRLLARAGVRAFVYSQVGYNSRNQIPDSWRQFHDRVSLTYNKIPDGYFSIFKEIADMVVAMINGGVPVGSQTVPDISVGMGWADHWKIAGLEATFGERIKYAHNYPDYFPQAASNPQPAWVYPDQALPEFRRWIKQVYFKDKFPGYMSRQVSEKGLPPSIAELVLKAIVPTAIEE